MSKLRLLFSLILGLAIVFGQAGAVHAAPPLQGDTPITGTIQSIVVETDTTVVVTLLVNGESQTLRLSVETAISLGLVDGDLVVNESMVGTDVEIDPSTIIPDETPVEEKQHPVGAKIADFFSEFFSVDYEMVMSSHSDGFGFGVITQALWITQKLGGDETLFLNILEAKKSRDYSLVALPDGTIPQNWGQFKKAVLKGEDGNSVGDVMSDKDKQNNGNGKPETPPGQDKDKQNNGNGKPENPPGQNKDKQNNGNGKP